METFQDFFSELIPNFLLHNLTLVDDVDDNGDDDDDDDDDLAAAEDDNCLISCGKLFCHSQSPSTTYTHCLSVLSFFVNNNIITNDLYHHHFCK